MRANVSSAASAAAGGIGETLGILAVLAIRLYSDASDTAGRWRVTSLSAPKTEGYVSYRLS